MSPMVTQRDIVATSSDSSVTFVAPLARIGRDPGGEQRYCITIPKALVSLLPPNRTWQITMRLMGSVGVGIRT